MTGDDPTVFVIDDDHGVRGAVQALVRAAAMEARTFASGGEFFSALDIDPTGCVVVDLCLADGRSGLDVQEELLRRGSDLPVILIAGVGTVADSVRALRNGAVDFVLKPFLPHILLARIREAIDLHRTRRSIRLRREAVDRRLARLTPQERAAMRLLEAGATSKQVADALTLSVRTVEGHRRRLLRKLEVGSVAQMVLLLARAGRTPAES